MKKIIKCFPVIYFEVALQKLNLSSEFFFVLEKTCYTTVI